MSNKKRILWKMAILGLAVFVISAISFVATEYLQRRAMARSEYEWANRRDEQIRKYRTYLQETLKKKGVDRAMECRVYEVCNPLQAKKVLEADGAMSTALPCRISVYGAKGEYTLATMRPTELLKAFSLPGVEGVAKEVEAVIVRMMQDAAGSSK